MRLVKRLVQAHELSICMGKMHVEKKGRAGQVAFFGITALPTADLKKVTGQPGLLCYISHESKGGTALTKRAKNHSDRLQVKTDFSR